MPIEEKTETVERTQTTKRYVCDYPGCEESTESFDPRGDSDVANPNCHMNHDLNWIALNPHTSAWERSGHTMQKALGEEAGVYLCDDHLHAAGELLAERRKE